MLLDSKYRNIVDIAIATPDLSSLVNNLVKQNLVNTIKNLETITVLAPTNEAFSNANLCGCGVNVSQVLKNHVINDLVLAQKVSDKLEVQTLNKKLTVEISNGEVYFVLENGIKAKVIATDILGSNGIVHLIDTVLI